MTKRVFFIVGIGFFVIPFVIWCVSLAKFIKCSNIAKYGTETTANVVEYASNLEVNDRPIYCLIFEFEDKDGIFHTGKTSNRYSYSEAKNISTLVIKYNSNFDAIEADFKYTYQIELWLLPIFWSIGAVFLGIFVSFIVNDIRNKKIVQSGIETTGSFIQSKCLFSVNNKKMFYIMYEYTDRNNQIHTNKTKCQYDFYQAQFFEKLGNFKIKYINNKSCITEKIVLSKVNQNQLETTKNKTQKICLYCDSVVDFDKKECPNCGSKKFKS